MELAVELAVELLLLGESETDFFDRADLMDRVDLDDLDEVWVSDLANGGNLFLEGELPMASER